MAGMLLIAAPVHAGSRGQDLPLIYETQPGFRYPGPFDHPRTFVIFQKPAGGMVWNGRWYVYQHPYEGYGYVLRRSY